ncbi:MAG: bifunctional UDP-N-acetylglucosamine diphosphorylase/glucosamine-1-phosphate N-acetyltransferase GlmU [Alphaproteobacteria bacterium]
MNITTVILAAGLGKRMRSATPKALNTLANAPFLEILLHEISALAITDIRVVLSEDMLKHLIVSNLQKKYPFKAILQKDRLGTAHAAIQAINQGEKNPILILNGDSPLITKRTLKSMIDRFESEAFDVLNVGFKAKNPKGYGRLITYGDDLIEIVEDSHLDGKKADNALCNSGIYIIKGEHAEPLLSKVIPNSVNQELYITDIIKLANQAGLKVSFSNAPEREVCGINTQMQRAKAEKLMQKRLAKEAMENGVKVIAPDTVFFSYDTKLGENVTIHQYVIFGANVTVENDCEIMPFTHIEKSTIDSDTAIGPFARIRPNSAIGKGCKIGNFVEVKASKIGDGSKASHLSYIGDANIGEFVNIGAGTIFCNYDGFEKYKTEIGDNTLVGANSALVAPVKIGKNVIIGAGSTVTEDAQDGSLVIARARQTNYQQKAQLIKDRKAKKKSER